MASDFTLVDPKGWEYDLHSVYSAYMGYFQIYNVPWYERSWGHHFQSFEEFLAFSWPVIIVTDAWTGRAHIVTRLNSIGAFLKMIKTRFGETLPQAPNILQVTPFENTNRHLRNVSDYPSYKKLHSTLPAAVLAALKTRVRTGEPKAIQELWDRRDKTFLAIDFEWSERNQKSCLEWGYAAVRCGHLEAVGHWPPNPDTNYRKGHYIVAEYLDKVTNKHCPNHPWQYAFAESQVASKAKLPQIIQAVISSLASPESEMTPNTLVLVAHGISGDLRRLEEMKIKIPNNVLIIDTSVYERVLYKMGHRGLMADPKTGKPRDQGMTLSLENLLVSFTIPTLRASSPAPSLPSTGTGTEEQTPQTTTSTPPDGPPQIQTQQMQQTPQLAQLPIVLPQCTMHNAGNDAMLCLFALQKLLEPAGTRVPSVKKGRVGRPGAGQQQQQQQQLGNTPGMYVNGMGMNGMVPMNGMVAMNGMNGMAMNGMGMGMNMGMVPMPMLSPTLSPMMTGSPLMPVVPMSPGGSHHKRSGSGPYDLAGEFGQMGLGAGMGMTRAYTTGQFLTAGAAENGGEREKEKGGSWGRAVGAGRGRR